MCTLIVRVPDDEGQPVRLIAVRDEDPARDWNALGPWWPRTHPGTIGVQDARAGGAWLAALPDEGRLAVLLNVGGPMPQPGLASRGEVVLDAVVGIAPDPNRRTQPYALVTVDGSSVALTLSDGTTRTTQAIGPGVHMLVNSTVVDDETFARVERWLPEFRAATPEGEAEDWFEGWIGVLERSAELPPSDDAAIIRDNRPYGIGTLSLLMCSATITPGSALVDYVEFGEPGLWGTRFHISQNTQ